MLTDLSGQIERITFTNEENGFTIAKVKVQESWIWSRLSVI